MWWLIGAAIAVGFVELLYMVFRYHESYDDEWHWFLPFQIANWVNEHEEERARQKKVGTIRIVERMTADGERYYIAEIFEDNVGPLRRYGWTVFVDGTYPTVEACQEAVEKEREYQRRVDHSKVMGEI